MAVEIRSTGDREADISEKIRVYLLSGTSLVIVVDPDTRSARLCDRTGTRTLSHADVLQHEALPGFAIALDRLFANALG